MAIIAQRTSQRINTRLIGCNMSIFIHACHPITKMLSKNHILMFVVLRKNGGCLLNIRRTLLQVDGIGRELNGNRFYGHLTSSRYPSTIHCCCRDISRRNIHSFYNTFLSYSSNFFIIAGPFQDLVVGKLRSYIFTSDLLDSTSEADTSL